MSFQKGDRVEHTPVYAAYRGMFGEVVRQHPTDLKWFYVWTDSDGLRLWHQADLTRCETPVPPEA